MLQTELKKFTKIKTYLFGFKIGVSQLDELTGGFKLGTLNTILGFTR